jgi:hypothetical protein
MDIAAGGDPQAWFAGDFAAYLTGARYRSKWYIDDGDGRCCSASAFTDNTCSSTPNGSWWLPRCPPRRCHSTLRHYLDIADRMGGATPPNG